MRLISILSVFVAAALFSSAVFAAEEVEDSSSGLPETYALNYLIASATLSPDKKLAIIYPKQDPEEEFPDGRDYLVALQPFAILGALETKRPYFQNENNGGINAEWSQDSSVALVTIDSKWGPGDVFLLEIGDNGKLRRRTNVLAKAHDLLIPDYRKSKASPYNDVYDFIFEAGEGPSFKLESNKQVIVDGHATTEPKGVSNAKWSAHLKAVWNVAEARFAVCHIARR